MARSNAEYLYKVVLRATRVHPRRLSNLHPSLCMRQHLKSPLAPPLLRPQILPRRPPAHRLSRHRLDRAILSLPVNRQKSFLAIEPFRQRHRRLPNALRLRDRCRPRSHRCTSDSGRRRLPHSLRQVFPWAARKAVATDVRTKLWGPSRRQGRPTYRRSDGYRNATMDAPHRRTADRLSLLLLLRRQGRGLLRWLWWRGRRRLRRRRGAKSPRTAPRRAGPCLRRRPGCSCWPVCARPPNPADAFGLAARVGSLPRPATAHGHRWRQLPARWRAVPNPCRCARKRFAELGSGSVLFDGGGRSARLVASPKSIK